MCISGATKPIYENPIVNIGGEKDAFFKIGGKGDAYGIGVGNKGKGFVQMGGRGEGSASVAVGRVGSKGSFVQFGGTGHTLMGGTQDKGYQFLGLRSSDLGLKRKKGGEQGPPDIRPLPATKRSSEFAVKEAVESQKRKLSLLGLKRFLLTSGRGDTSKPLLGKHDVLGF